MTDFQTMVTQINGDSLIPRKNVFGGPSVCCIWNESYVFGFGFLDTCAPPAPALGS